MKSKSSTIYIVRHGETEWNMKRLIQGQKDSALTELGINQAKELAKELRKIKFDLVFSSDLLRAKRTAEIIVAEHNLAVETTELLRERNFGDFEGKPVQALRAFDEFISTLSHKQMFKYKSSPNVESDEEIATRLITFLREAAISHPGKKILAVTHGGIMKALFIKLGIVSYKKRAWVANGSYVKLESDGVDFFVKETKGIQYE